MPLIISGILNCDIVVLARSGANSVSAVYIVVPSMTLCAIVVTPHVEYRCFFKMSSKRLDCDLIGKVIMYAGRLGTEQWSGV